MIDAKKQAVWVLRVDPENVEIIARRRPDISGEGVAAIDGAIERGLSHIKDVGVPGVHEDSTEVFVAYNTRIFRRFCPRCASIIGAVKTLFHYGVEASPVGTGSDADAKATPVFFGQTFRDERIPCGPSVDGFVNQRIGFSAAFFVGRGNRS